MVPLSQLFAWGAITEDEAAEYNTSWWLFGFLINRHRGELARYVAELAAACAGGCPFPPEHQVALWERAFPSLPVSAVDSELRRWIYGGSHLVLHFNVAPREDSITERRLGDPDAYAVRGMLHVIGPGDIAKARGELATAISLDPMHVLARLFMTGLDRTSLAVPDARALVAAHGDDWRAWWLLSDALDTAHGDPDERAAARDTTCALAAQNPAVVPPPELCGRRGDDTVSR